MLKRKYGDRAEWTRVTDRRFTQAYLDEVEFKGYVTYLKVLEVTEPLFVQYGEKKVCIVDNGFTWLQHFPQDEQFSVTTMFDSNGEIVQWYIDICHQIGIENGRPWLDDLFLDIVVLPTGEIFLIDEDELEEALVKRMIDLPLYELARSKSEAITRLIEVKEFPLLELTKIHKVHLQGWVEKQNV
ncbi:DUF402 domain-containing protein [Heyndrickxia sp. MSNUG]|uniref:DUF402 domain-containing protein n=1 Tax=Heyndrickxia sp. MSNUG TaxID=3136677 RepID=UPI003C2B44D2